MPNLVDPDSLANIISGGAIFAKLPGVLPILAAVLTYVQMQQMSKGQSQANESNENDEYNDAIYDFVVWYTNVWWTCSLLGCEHVIPTCSTDYDKKEYKRGSEIV